MKSHQIPLNPIIIHIKSHYISIVISTIGQGVLPRLLWNEGVRPWKINEAQIA